MPSKEVTHITAARGWQPLNLRELWDYRELLFFLAVRDVSLRYKQTAFGVAWAVLQPLSTMIVFAVVFGRLGGLPSDGVPYFAFVLSALIPWSFISAASSQAANSLVAEQRLLTKVYFPRVLLPGASILACAVDCIISLSFAIALLLIVSFCGGPHWVPSYRVLSIPALIAAAALVSFAVGTWMSAVNVFYRDVRYVLPFVTQLWMYSSPVAYSSTLVPDKYRLLYALNPSVAVIEGFRWALNGTSAPSPGTCALSLLTTTLLLSTGLMFFRRVESSFADVI
jgi:lipopolysaccharide transport system permease protein